MVTTTTAAPVDEFDALEKHEVLIIGFVYLAVPFVLLCNYSLYFVITLGSKEFRALQSIRLMLCLSVLDYTQLLCHFISGFLTLFGSINTNYPYLCKFIGGVLNSAWVGLFPMSVVVAIDRLLVVRKATNSDDGFPIPIKIGLTISVVYCVGFLICLATFAEVTYSPNDGAWGYGSDHGSVVMSDIEFVVSVACIVTTFVIYLLIIASIYKMKQGVSMRHGTEMQLFANATILFVILVTLLTCWHYYQLFLPDTLWTVFAINVYWMLYCGAMPFLSILFTRSTRMSYLRLLRLKPAQRSTVSIIRSKSMVR